MFFCYFNIFLKYGKIFLAFLIFLLYIVIVNENPGKGGMAGHGEG